MPNSMHNETKVLPGIIPTKKVDPRHNDPSRHSMEVLDSLLLLQGGKPPTLPSAENRIHYEAQTLNVNSKKEAVNVLDITGTSTVGPNIRESLVRPRSNPSIVKFIRPVKPMLVEQKTSMAIFGNVSPSADTSTIANVPSGKAVKQSVSKAPSNLASALSRQKPEKPVWRVARPDSFSILSVQLKSMLESSEKEESADELMPDLGTTVFNRYLVQESHREKAKEMARKAREMINATAKVKSKKSFSEKPVPKPAVRHSDFDIFERLQQRMSASRTPVNVKEMEKILGLIDEEGPMEDILGQKSEFRQDEVESRPEKLSELMMYSPSEAIERRARGEKTADDGGIPIVYPDYRQPEEQVLGDIKDGNTFNNQVTSIGNVPARGHYAGLPPLVTIKTSRKVLVPIRKNKMQEAEAKLVAPLFSKEESDTKEKFKFFKDFEVLLSREAHIQNEVSTTLGHVTDVAKTSLKGLLNDTDRFDMIWNAFVHIRHMDHAPINAEDSEMIYSILVTPDATQHKFKLKDQISRMDRKRFVYLKALSGHLHRIAIGGEASILRGLSDVFAELFFRCVCPTTGDVYESPVVAVMTDVEEIRATIMSKKSAMMSRASTHISFSLGADVHYLPYSSRPSEYWRSFDPQEEDEELDNLFSNSSRNSLVIKGVHTEAHVNPRASQRRSTVRSRTSSKTAQDKPAIQVNISPEELHQKLVSERLSTGKKTTQSRKNSGTSEESTNNTSGMDGSEHFHTMHVKEDVQKVFNWDTMTHEILKHRVLNGCLPLTPFGCAIELLLQNWNFFFTQS